MNVLFWDYNYPPELYEPGLIELCNAMNEKRKGMDVVRKTFVTFDPMMTMMRKKQRYDPHLFTAPICKLPSDISHLLIMSVHSVDLATDRYTLTDNIFRFDAFLKNSHNKHCNVKL